MIFLLYGVIHDVVIISTLIYMYLHTYSGKFLKGFIFENFENDQAFSKIFFRNC